MFLIRNAIKPVRKELNSSKVYVDVSICSVVLTQSMCMVWCCQFGKVVVGKSYMLLSHLIIVLRIFEHIYMKNRENGAYSKISFFPEFQYNEISTVDKRFYGRSYCSKWSCGTISTMVDANVCLWIFWGNFKITDQLFLFIIDLRMI